MIRMNLEIADPTRSDGPKLLALAALFTALAQGSTAEQARAALDEKVAGVQLIGGQQPGKATRLQLADDVASTTGTLDPADNPETGIPSPAEAFGVGNGAAGSGSVPSPSPASTGAASTTGQPLPAPGAGDALPEPAAVFSGNAVPLTPPAGTPPAPSNGVQTAGASTQASGGVELDVEGIPWDASIHASTKAKLASGAWKVKRGTPELYLKERKAVLLAALAAGNGAASGGVPATPPASASVPPPGGAGAPVPPPPSNPGNVPAPIATPQASAQTTPAAAGSSPTMAQLLPRVTAAITAGLLTPDTTAALAKEISGGAIDNVAMFAIRPDLIPALWARLDVLGIPA